MGKPAARITDMHTCPMVTPGTPPIPHVGGPVVQGSHNVITGKLPQARVGDMAICVGPPDVIAMGSTGVFVNSRPAARQGDQTAHGGVITVGLPTVLIGETKSGSGGGAAAPVSALQFGNYAAQVQALIDAYKAGTPFCEICFKNALAKLTAGAPPPAAKSPPVSPPATPPKSAPSHATAAPPTSTPKPMQNAIICEALTHTIQCEHGRAPSPEGDLMVVPGSISGGDTISGKITMKGGCANHPAWTVSGARGFQGKGANYTFRTSSVAPLTVTAEGLKHTKPEIYAVEASSCHTGARRYKVHAYPSGEASFKLALTEFRENFHKFLNPLPIGQKEKEGPKILIGEMKFSGAWKEDEGSWRAYFEDTFTASFSPLIGIEHRGQIYPPNLIPGWLARYVEAGLFLTVGLGVDLAGSFSGKYWPDTKKTVLGKREVSGGGSGTMKLSLDLKLSGPDLVQGSLSGSSGLGVKVALAQEEHATIEIQPKWDGIKASATLKAAWGLVEINRDFQLVAERTYDKWKWALDKTQKAT